MADDLDDGEFWLPPAFLSDDALLLEKEKAGSDGNCQPDLFRCRFGSFGSSSDLGSPVESVVGSTETESDEEDFLAGLTRRIAQSTLQKDDFGNSRTVCSSDKTKPMVLAGSPQSTLCDFGNGYGCKQGSSSNGSPNGPSRGSSPPPPPPATWDVLYAAAGEVARMSTNEEGTGYYDARTMLGSNRKPSPISTPTVKNPHGGFHYDQAPNHLNYPATQFQQLKLGFGQYQHPQMIQFRGRSNEFVNNRSSRPLGLSPSAWPPLQQSQSQNQKQQQKISGMRSVFLDTPGPKRTSVGTGVFLPRRINTPSEARKRPARVVQNLNLNLEEMSAQGQLQPRSDGSFVTDSDAALNLRSGGANLAQQKRTPHPQPAATNHEIRLPPEWIY